MLHLGGTQALEAELREKQAHSGLQVKVKKRNGLSGLFIFQEAIKDTVLEDLVSLASIKRIPSNPWSIEWILPFTPRFE